MPYIVRFCGMREDFIFGLAAIYCGNQASAAFPCARRRLFRAQKGKFLMRRGRPRPNRKRLFRAQRGKLFMRRGSPFAPPSFVQKGNHFPPLRMPGAEKDPFFSIRARQNAPFSAFRGGKCFTEKIKKTLAFTNVFFWMRQLPILPEGDPQVLSA